MGFQDHKPTILMLLMQFMYAGVTLGTRTSLLHGMSPRVFVVYRQAIASLLLAPLAFLTSRKSNGCHLGWKSFWMIFMLSLIGVTINQNIYFEGLYLASSSIASAMGNLLPAITFLIAYIFGIEKISNRSLRSIAKIMGTVVCVAGAIAMVMLKGPKLLNMEYPKMHSLFINNGGETWLLGCLLLFGSNICWSSWLILQVPVSACYPDHLSLTAWMCFIATLQSAIVTFFIEPDVEIWKLNSFEELGCCFYGAVGSAITFFTQAWCISKRGPLFSAMFSPLSTVIVTFFACIFLREEMYTGSLVGGLAVISGLYVVLWGKAKDHDGCKKPEEHVKQTTSIDISSDKTDCIIDLNEPLLPSKSSDFKDDQLN